MIYQIFSKIMEEITLSLEILDVLFIHNIQTILIFQILIHFLIMVQIFNTDAFIYNILPLINQEVINPLYHLAYYFKINVITTLNY